MTEARASEPSLFSEASGCASAGSAVLSAGAGAEPDAGQVIAAPLCREHERHPKGDDRSRRDNVAIEHCPTAGLRRQVARPKFG